MAGEYYSSTVEDLLKDIKLKLASGLPVASVVNIITVSTAAAGANWTAFAAGACDMVDIVNNTGVDIEYRRNNAGSAITVPDHTTRMVTGITDANQISVRRVDQSNVQVTLTAEAITR